MASEVTLSVELVGEVKHRGFKRGCYQLILTEVGNRLQTNCVLETKTFGFGGFDWRLAVWKGFENSNSLDKVRVVLLSCNDVAVHADVALIVGQKAPARNALLDRKSKVAFPFCPIERQYILTSQLAQPNTDSLVITADLKNVRAATESEKRKAGTQARTVHLEVISNESINKPLYMKKRFGITFPDFVRNSDVYSSSLVHLWAQERPDHRYWLCKRSPDGSLTMMRCLNDVGAWQCFGDLCDESKGSPWVTLFEEEKRSNESFQSVDQDTMIIFWKLFEAPYEDFSHLGHLLVQKTTSCPDLFTRIADDMAQFAELEEWDAYLEQERQQIRNITGDEKSLKQCGLLSGSVVIVRKRTAEEELPSAESVRRALLEDAGAFSHRKGDTDPTRPKSRDEDDPAPPASGRTGNNISTSEVQSGSFPAVPPKSRQRNSRQINLLETQGLSTETLERSKSV